MTSEAEDIFSRFYLRVEDYKLAGLDEEVVNEMLTGYIKSVIAKSYVRRLFLNISIDEDIGTIDYTMRESIDDDTDKEFVEELLSLGMVAEWISPKFHSTLNTSQFFSNSEQKWYSQANHMAELKAMYEKAQNDFRKYIRDRGYSLSLVNSE